MARQRRYTPPPATMHSREVNLLAIERESV